MKMLRLLGLMVFVVFVAAFASGCGGGGGGGGGTTDTTPPATTPEPTPDPEPDDSQRIASARASISTILANARTRAQTAQSVANQIQSNADATAEQITRALNHSRAAQSALSVIEAASREGIAATTAAQAEAALAKARTASGNLDASASALASIQGDVQAAANRRRQRAADETAQTGGSSLIKEIRDNRRVFDAVLTAMKADDADPLTVGPTAAGALAVYPKNTGTGTSRVVGERKVTVNTLSSSGKTLKLKGTGRLPYGFDMKSGTLFVNAYTDITQTRPDVRMRTNVLMDDRDTPDTDERYTTADVPDADYLLAGIWLQNDAIEAFAYGSQPLNVTPAPTFCSGIENVNDATSAEGGRLSRSCTDPTDFHLITSFVGTDKVVDATYQGDANGAYLAEGEASYFTAKVKLDAEFVNEAGTGSGTIKGAVTNIQAGGQMIAGSIELQEDELNNDISGLLGGSTAGVVAGSPYLGNWKGQFFGIRTRRSSVTATDDDNDPKRTTTTTYAIQAPGSVAGTFYAIKQSAAGGDGAFIGTFGAHR